MPVAALRVASCAPDDAQYVPGTGGNVIGLPGLSPPVPGT